MYQMMMTEVKILPRCRRGSHSDSSAVAIG
jgi:hypothetical protein